MIYYYYFMYLTMSYFIDILCEDQLRELLMRRNQSLIGLAKNYYPACAKALHNTTTNNRV